MALSRRITSEAANAQLYVCGFMFMMLQGYSHVCTNQPITFSIQRFRFNYILKRTHRKEQITKEWLAKLPQISRDLEFITYVSAPSLQEYTDKGSVKKRLFRAAIKIKRSNFDNRSGGR